MQNFSSFRCYSTATLFERVLDIGSGDNPHPRADVILDSNFSNEHRWGNLKREKPLVLGHVEQLPFRTKAFDVALCFHVLEHVRDPIKAASEFERVAWRGICEVPTLYGDVLFQPYSGHRWVFARSGDGLIYADHPGELSRFSTVETTLFLLRRNYLFQAAFLADRAAFRTRIHWNVTFPIRKVQLEDIIRAYVVAINDTNQSGAIKETILRMLGYVLDLGAAGLRRGIRRIVR